MQEKAACGGLSSCLLWVCHDPDQVRWYRVKPLKWFHSRATCLSGMAQPSRAIPPLLGGELPASNCCVSLAFPGRQAKNLCVQRQLQQQIKTHVQKWPVSWHLWRVLALLGFFWSLRQVQSNRRDAQHPSSVLHSLVMNRFAHKGSSALCFCKSCYYQMHPTYQSPPGAGAPCIAGPFSVFSYSTVPWGTACFGTPKSLSFT